MAFRKILFFIVNAALVIFAAIWLVPGVVSWQTARAELHLAERRYALEVQFLAEFPSNLLEFEQLQAPGILQEHELLPALAEFSAKCAFADIETLEFTAAEVVAGYFLDSRFLEKRVRVEYEGEFFYLLNFLRQFSTVRTRAFSLEGNRLRVEFSLFGIG